RVAALASIAGPSRTDPDRALPDLAPARNARARERWPPGAKTPSGPSNPNVEAASKPGTGVGGSRRAPPKRAGRGVPDRPRLLNSPAASGLDALLSAVPPDGRYVIRSSGRRGQTLQSA